MAARVVAKEEVENNAAFAEFRYNYWAWWIFKSMSAATATANALAIATGSADTFATASGTNKTRIFKRKMALASRKH